MDRKEELAQLIAEKKAGQRQTTGLGHSDYQALSDAFEPVGKVIRELETAAPAGTLSCKYEPTKVTIHLLSMVGSQSTEVTSSSTYFVVKCWRDMLGTTIRFHVEKDTNDTLFDQAEETIEAVMNHIAEHIAEVTK